MTTKIIKNLSEADYNAIPALRSSLVTTINKKTMAHAKAQIDGVFEQTDAMRIGSAFHDYLLRAELFKTKWAILPEGHKGTTKEGKELKATLEATHGENILKHDDLSELMLMSAGVKANSFSKVLLENVTDTELTLVWNEDGVDCKARIDAVCKFGDKTLLLDLKTARAGDKDDFERSLVNYGYHIQSAHYLAGAKACGLIKGDNNDFIHIVVEKDAPYLTANYCIDDGSLDLAQIQRYEAMRKYKLALETNQWPGYPAEIQTVALPHWFFQQQNTETFDSIGA